MLSGIHLFLNLKKTDLLQKWFWGLYLILVLCVGLGFFADNYPILGGLIGYELNDLAADYIGKTGTILVISFLVLIYLVLRLKFTPQQLAKRFKV